MIRKFLLFYSNKKEDILSFAEFYQEYVRTRNIHENTQAPTHVSFHTGQRSSMFGILFPFRPNKLNTNYVILNVLKDITVQTLYERYSNKFVPFVGSFLATAMLRSAELDLYPKNYFNMGTFVYSILKTCADFAIGAIFSPVMERFNMLTIIEVILAHRVFTTFLDEIRIKTFLFYILGNFVEMSENPSSDEFIEQVPSVFVCNICKDFLNNAIEFESFYFCESCLHEWIDKHNHIHPCTGSPAPKRNMRRDAIMTHLASKYRRILLSENEVKKSIKENSQR